MNNDISVEGRIRLRLTHNQHRHLLERLFADTPLESVAIVVCGRGGTPTDEILLVQDIVPIPSTDYREQSSVRLTWHTERLLPVLDVARRRNLAIMKIHSHPGGYYGFSELDNAADRDLFPSVHGWTDSSRPHISAIMVPDGRILARSVSAKGEFSSSIEVISIGESILFLGPSVARDAYDPSQSRTRQAFGAATTSRLQNLSIGLVGCSGTGSWVAELLTRLGVGELVVVDPDTIEDVNLNRVLHASVLDVRHRTAKVDVVRRAVEQSGLPTRVETHQKDVFDASVVRRLSRCDVLIGCVDQIDARDLLCRVATFYLQPYIDVGVRLVADGKGGIEHIVGGAQYFSPMSPSLIDRGIYTPKQLADAGLRRSDPDAYGDQIRARYILNATETRPAVASVNAFYASLAVNELLERLHPYRESATPLGVMASLSQLRFVSPEPTASRSGLQKHVGKGDTSPLLGYSYFSEPK